MLIELRAFFKAQSVFEQQALSQVAALRSDVNAQLGALRIDAFAEIDAQAMLLQTQLASTRHDAFGELDQLRGAVLLTAVAALKELDLTRQSAEGQLTLANITLAHGVAAAMDTTEHASSLMDAYAVLPERAVKSPAWLAIEPEITCRTAAGAGYGGCWHSRITGIMGEAVNVGGVFTKRFPEFSGSITGIAADVHTFTSKAVAPRGFWGSFKDVLSTGSGVTRALGAAGLFDIAPVAAPVAGH